MRLIRILLSQATPAGSLLWSDPSGGVLSEVLSETLNSEKDRKIGLLEGVRPYRYRAESPEDIAEREACRRWAKVEALGPRRILAGEWSWKASSRKLRRFEERPGLKDSDSCEGSQYPTDRNLPV
jgi:hypothetical protein